MGDFGIVFDLLAPQHAIVREYVGHHPSRVLKEIPDIMKEVWRLKGSKFFEDKIKWDISGDPIDFFGQWRGRDQKYDYSNVWIKVHCIGKMATQTKMGHVTIWLTGTLETKLPYNNVFDEALKYFYLKLIYEQQMKNYLIDAKAKVIEFDNKLRERLDIMKIETEGGEAKKTKD